jgi:nucleoside-diphosphate-sugar epimerase
VLASCRERGHQPTVVFSGTVTQAGITTRLPVNEDVADQPITVYDRHKLMAEDDLKSAASAGVVRGVSLRLPNIYGPGATAGSRDRDVLNRMIRAAMRGEALTVYGAGDYVRDYLFIDDAVTAFLLAATCAEALNGRHFVIATGRGHAIRNAFATIAARVEAKCGRRVRVTTEPGRTLTAIEQRHFIGDSSRFTAATGWRAACDLDDGIDRTIEAYQCES